MADNDSPTLNVPEDFVFNPRVLESMARGLAELEATRQRISRTIAEGLAQFIEQSLPTFQLLADQIPGLLSALPPNIRALGKDLKLSSIDEIATTEGLQFGWVVPTSIVRLLLHAQSAGERREIIRRKSPAIARCCVTELNGVSTPRLAWYVRSARRSAEALLAGHTEASQALSTNLLDTLLSREAVSIAKLMKQQKVQPDFDEFTLAAAIVLPGLWRAYRHYRPGESRLVPRDFSRHASVHAVSRKQYTLANATIALTHCVAMILLVEKERI